MNAAVVNFPRMAQIRIDGGTQPRESISENIVAEYAALLRDGVAFPPLVVYFDGTEYWLADGFHRWHAGNAAGVEVAMDVRQGTRRDAVLHSVGANASHGLRRSNADKRKAVLTLLQDAEWAEWSDREIARRCQVGHPLVAELRKLIGRSSNQRTYTTGHGTEARYPAKSPEPASDSLDGNVTVEKSAESAPSSPPAAAPAATAARAPRAPSDEKLVARVAELEAENERLREELNEANNNLRAAFAENADLVRITEADDKLAEAMAVIKQQRAMVQTLESVRDGFMNEKNEAIQQAKYWRRKFENLEKGRPA